MSQHRDFFFERIMEAAKPALAVVIIYGIAFFMDWPNPYWGVVAAFSINLLSRGMTFYRGIIRVMGVILGGAAALVLIGLFPQERWAFMTAAMIPLFLFGYGCTGKNDYFYTNAGTTFSVLIGVTWAVQDWTSGTTYLIWMLRITLTFAGALVIVLVTAFIWPKTTIRDFEGLVRRGWANQRKLYAAVRRSISGEDVGEEARRLRLNDVEIQEQTHVVMHVAEQDSFQMLESGHDWHEFLHLSAAQVEGLESLRESLADVRGLDLLKLLPDLDVLCSELERRFEQIERMLAERSPTAVPQAVPLSIDEAEIEALSQFQRAAVAAIKTRLESLEAISRSLFERVARIRMFELPHAEHDAHAGHGAHAAHGAWLALDPDRIRLALGVVASVWIGFLCWIYVNDVPNHSVFWAMSGVTAFLTTSRSEMRISTLLFAWGVGAVVAFICRVFIMQHLSGFHELAAVIFVVSFFIGYVLYPAAHPGVRIFALASFAIVLQADNEQSYSLEDAIHFVLWLWMTVSIALISRSLFTHWRPEKMFLRIFDRFFRQAHLLISAHGPEGPQGILTRWKMVFFQNDLLDLPRKCALYASPNDSAKMVPGAATINYKALGTTPDKVQELLMSLFLLASRVKDLLAARALPRMDAVEDQLREVRQEWRQLVEEWFRRRAAEPAKAMEPVADLSSRLAGLEARTEEAFAGVDKRAFSLEDGENFYRLLSSYRGLSEAMINHARIVNGFDWPRWREMRF